MNDFFNRLSPKAPPHSQPLDPNQGLRMVHAPPLLPNTRGRKSSPPPILNSDKPLKLHLPNRGNRRDNGSSQLSEEELTVTNLRKVYSSLLEEMAPLHHEMGTGFSSAGDRSSSSSAAAAESASNFRWKNTGTVTVNGDDDEGYDYSYTPDDTKKSWRLQGQKGGAGNGVTGGDWSKDGIRRYHTGGAIERGGGAARSSNLVTMGSFDVDIGVMNGVELSPMRKMKPSGDTDDASGGDDVRGEQDGLDHKFSIDDGSVGSDVKPVTSEDRTENDAPLQNEGGLGIAPSGSSMEDVALAADGDAAPDISTSEVAQSSNKDSMNSGVSFVSTANNDSMTAFESLYHLKPSMAWRLRSAYSPQTPQEHHLASLGSEVLAHRHPDKADGIVKGLEVARNCEARVCDGLRSLGELISYCERLKGAKFALMRGKEKTHQRNSYAIEDDEGLQSFEEDEDEDEDEIESAEAMFAYFCEKNILPMLIDSLLCHPPPLTSEGSASSDNMVLPTNSAANAGSSSQSPFSGVTWTASVKSEILQTIAMILFNTSSPLSLTYLLSNNYMNELIMGVLPLSQFSEDALEEILPPYITLLRGLVMRLRGDEGRCCVPLLLCQRQRRFPGGQSVDGGPTETYIPLLYAAVQVFCSPFGTSLRDTEGCLIRTTAMNVILNLCRITETDVRQVLVQGVGDESDDGSPSLPTTKSAPSLAPPPSLLSHPLTLEQELLFETLCISLKSWYHRSVRLVMASLSIETKHDNHKTNHDEAKAEAKARHNDIAIIQFRELQYWLGFLDDLLSCDIRVWNARLVEWFLREVVVGTVLSRWSRSLDIIERKGSDCIKASPDVYKARAEARVSIVFLTQLFGMVEYAPLVRLVGAALLHNKYPRNWCVFEGGNIDVDFPSDSGFFIVTQTINAIIGKGAGEGSAATNAGEEADAGAGGGQKAESGVSDCTRGSSEAHDERLSHSNANEMDHRALETVAAEHDFRQLAQDVESKYSYEDDQLVLSRHRAALLNMLAGDPAYSSDETVLASMLFATILENDGIDNIALEIFSVLPSPVNGEGDSPFEVSIAKYLCQDWSQIDADSRSVMAGAIECLSTLGFMLLERLIFHTWTEGGTELDAVPFHHYYKSSKLIQALGTALTHFATEAQNHSTDTNAVRDILSDLIRQTYRPSSTDDLDSPHSRNESVRLVCSLQSRYPSNFIDNGSVLSGEVLSGGRSGASTTGDLFLFSEENEAAKFALRVTLHLRSLVGCLQDFYQRFTSPSCPDHVESRWSGEGESISFRTTEEADDILLSIGGIETSATPSVGTDIDLRGRKFFRCSLPRSSKFGRRNVSVDITIDANGTKITVSERADLVLVVDPSEIYVAKAKKDDPNRCTVLAVVSLNSIIASAPEGELFHMVLNAKELSIETSNMLKDGRLSLRFDRAEFSLTAKECMDKHCSAYEKKIELDLSDLLERCVLMGCGDDLRSPSPLANVGDGWCDFQQA